MRSSRWNVLVSAAAACLLLSGCQQGADQPPAPAQARQALQPGSSHTSSRVVPSHPAASRRSLRPAKQLSGRLPYQPGVLLVKFRESYAEQVDQALAGQLGLTLGYRSRIGIHVMRLARAETVPQAAARVSKDPRVVYAEPNYRIRLSRVPDDPRYPEKWGLDNTGQTGGTADADIDAPEAWDISVGSSSVVVAVLDTGVDYTHPDLADNMWINEDEIPGNGVDDDGNGYIDDVRGWNFESETNDPSDWYGHGTHCSGIIGATGNNTLGVVGVNWQVKIMPLMIIGQQSLEGFVLDAAEGVHYAVDNGADVMSCSWWTVEYYSQTLEDAFGYADQNGVITAAAAGNDTSDVETQKEVWPCEWTFPSIICVAATDHNDNIAYFSNWGAVSVDVGAPGDNILSTTPGSNYELMSGTSMATPYTAGVVALIRSIRPDLTTAELKQYLFSTVDPLTDLQGITTTGGRINAGRVMAAVSGVPLPPVAMAGSDRNVLTGSTVILDGTGSSDPNQDPITYAWTFYPPSTSSATLDDPTSPTPRFLADMCGDFSAQLVVTDDGGLESQPDSVTIHVNNYNELLPPIETEHPYDNNSDLTWTITQPGAAVIGLHFASFDTEPGWDFVYILDGNDTEWAVYDGDLGEFSTVLVNGDTIKVHFTSDGSVNRDGFVIDGYWWCGTGQCPAGRGDCDDDPSNGCETVTDDDVDNCGWCGHRCFFANADYSCSGGICQFDGCQAGWTDCDGDPNTGCEADLLADPDNCGTCGNICGPYDNATPGCDNGNCAIGGCDEGWDDCDGDLDNGCEMDVSSDASNCGACDNVCNLDHTTDVMCVDGVCTPGSCTEDVESIDSPHPYPSPYDNTWTITKTGATTVSVHFSLFDTEPGWDYVYIMDGADNVYDTLTGSLEPFWSVSVPGDTIKVRLVADNVYNAQGITIDASRYCLSGCEADWGNCDGDPANGCETDLLSDLEHCGGCNQPCGAPGTDSQCDNGTCNASDTCLTGFADCNTNPADGCEVNLNDDINNCGSCGTVCAFDHAADACVDGNCTLGECDGGWADCNLDDSDGCESEVAYDVDNCGACGNACNLPNVSDSYCYQGVCQINSCDNGWSDCDGVPGNGCEADVDTDVANCGSCGNACQYDNATPECVGGNCQMGACTGGHADCNTDDSDGCEADIWGDPNNCGDCTTTCGPYDHALAICADGTCRMACDENWGDCNASNTDGCETDLLGDPAHCGACGHVCRFDNATGQCQAGSCLMGACDNGFADCNNHPVDGCEVDLQTDATHCGACDNACSYSHGSGACVAGSCALDSCESGWGDCNSDDSDGCEAQLNIDPANCGACGQVCTLPGVAENGCVDGSCTVVSCNPGLDNCNGDAADGCEVDLNSDVDNCGSCGNACSFAHASAVCNQGSCVLATCDDNFADCNSDDSDGCETDLTTSENCGACGKACTAPAVCVQAGGDWFCGAGCADDDGDGYADASCGGNDCDDDDAAVNPAATETCNGADDDCDGTIDNGFDADGDGVTTCAQPADCDDNDAATYPGAPENCTDGKDNDCDGTADNGTDADGDGVRTCGEMIDCNDSDASSYPGAEEICDDGIDNNCDGIVDNCPGGCGCASGRGQGSAGLLALLLGLVLLRRRRS